MAKLPKKMMIHLKESYTRIRKKKAPPMQVILDKKKDANKYFCRKKTNDENNRE